MDILINNAKNKSLISSFSFIIIKTLNNAYSHMVVG